MLCQRGKMCCHKINPTGEPCVTCREMFANGLEPNLVALQDGKLFTVERQSQKDDAKTHTRSTWPALVRSLASLIGTLHLDSFHPRHKPTAVTLLVPWHCSGELEERGESMGSQGAEPGFEPRQAGTGGSKLNLCLFPSLKIKGGENRDNPTPDEEEPKGKSRTRRSSKLRAAIPF